MIIAPKLLGPTVAHSLNDQCSRSTAPKPLQDPRSQFPHRRNDHIEMLFVRLNEVSPQTLHPVK